MADPDMMAGLRNVFGRPADDSDDADQTPPGQSGGLARLVQPGPGDAAPTATTVPDPPRLQPSTGNDHERAAAGPDRRRKLTNDQRRLRRKTSLSLPPAIRRRLTDAYTVNRWTFGELVDEGLTQLRQGRIQLADVERTLRTISSDEATGTKTVALPVDVLDDLDRYAAEWRLSRSQLVAAIVNSVIDTL